MLSFLRIMLHELLRKPHLEQFVWTIGRSNAQLLQELHKKATESLESAWQAHLWMDLDEHVLGGVHVERLQA